MFLLLPLPLVICACSPQEHDGHAEGRFQYVKASDAHSEDFVFDQKSGCISSVGWRPDWTKPTTEKDKDTEKPVWFEDWICPKHPPLTSEQTNK